VSLNTKQPTVVSFCSRVYTDFRNSVVNLTMLLLLMLQSSMLTC